MNAPDLPLLVVAGAGLIVAGLAHENINLSLHRLGAIFGLDCLNTAMILLDVAVRRVARSLSWAHNNGADHPVVNRARVLVRTSDGEFHLPNATAREHGIADRRIVTEHEVVCHRSRVLPLDDLVDGRVLHYRIERVLIRRRDDHCGRAELAACDPYCR